MTDVEVFFRRSSTGTVLSIVEMLSNRRLHYSTISSTVFTVGLAEIETAKDIVLGHGSGARDALHVAAMRSHDVAQNLTFDRDSTASSDRSESTAETAVNGERRRHCHLRRR